MIKAIIFDVDNTLVDFMRVKRKAVAAAAHAMIDAGLDVTKEEAVQQIFDTYEREGIEDQKVFNKMLEEAYGHVDYRILAAGIVGYRKAKEGNLVLYPHVRVTIATLLKKGLHLAVVTDAPRMEAWIRLVSLGLDSFFDTVVTHEDTGKRKPDPAPFKLALKRLGVKPEEAIMIGDWPERDMAGAKALKMKAVFAKYGTNFNHEKSGADFEVTDIAQLVDVVDKLNSGR